MRLYIKQIIEAINVTEEVAKKIEFQMECSGFDFSEATNEEFAKEAKWAMLLWQKTAYEKFISPC